MTPQIQALRSQISALKQSISNVENDQVRLPLDEATAALDAQLAAHQSEGEVRLTAWADRFAQPTPPAPSAYSNPLDPAGLARFLALDPTAVRDRLVALLTASYAITPALSRAERPAWLAARRAELFVLEVEEGAAARLANVPRRIDADPRAGV